MRRARANDYWRAILAYRSWAFKLQRLEYENVTGIGSGHTKFRLPLNIICGPNGVGKTTLLRAIWATLAPAEAGQLETTKFRLRSGTTKIEIEKGDNTSVIEVDFSDFINAETPDAELEVSHVDTSSVVSELQNYFCKFPNIQDALNGVPVLECTQENLETLSYLTQIPFTRAKVYTLEEADRERPFFEVRTGQTEYDTRSMGLGELAAFYIWWALERATDHTVLLIEEPESFLSPMCQFAFSDVLAK